MPLGLKSAKRFFFITDMKTIFLCSDLLWGFYFVYSDLMKKKTSVWSKLTDPFLLNEDKKLSLGCSEASKFPTKCQNSLFIEDHASDVIGRFLHEENSIIQDALQNTLHHFQTCRNVFVHSNISIHVECLTFLQVNYLKTTCPKKIMLPTACSNSSPLTDRFPSTFCLRDMLFTYDRLGEWRFHTDNSIRFFYGTGFKVSKE